MPSIRRPSNARHHPGTHPDRGPVDRPIPASPNMALARAGEGDLASSARLAIDRADARLHGVLATVSGDPGLRDEARLRREAVDERERAVDLRTEASEVVAKAKQEAQERERQAQERRQAAVRTEAEKRGDAQRKRGEVKKQAARARERGRLSLPVPLLPAPERGPPLLTSSSAEPSRARPPRRRSSQRAHHQQAAVLRAGPVVSQTWLTSRARLRGAAYRSTNVLGRYGHGGTTSQSTWSATQLRTPSKPWACRSRRRPLRPMRPHTGTMGPQRDVGRREACAGAAVGSGCGDLALAK